MFLARYLAQGLKVDESLFQADVAPDGLLHAEGDPPVLPVDVDGGDLVLDRSPHWLQPCDDGLVALQEVGDQLGRWIQVGVGPGLASVDNVHVGDIQRCSCCCRLGRRGTTWQAWCSWERQMLVGHEALLSSSWMGSGSRRPTNAQNMGRGRRRMGGTA